MTDTAKQSERFRLVLELIKVDLTAGDLPPKTRVALALSRVCAALKENQ